MKKKGIKQKLNKNKQISGKKKKKEKNKLTKTNTTTCFRTTYITAASVSVIVVVGKLLFKTAPKTSFLPKFFSLRFLFFSFFNFISFIVAALQTLPRTIQNLLLLFYYHNKFVLCKNIFIYFGQFLLNVNIKLCFYFTQLNKHHSHTKYFQPVFHVQSTQRTRRN